LKAREKRQEACAMNSEGIAPAQAKRIAKFNSATASANRHCAFKEYFRNRIFGYELHFPSTLPYAVHFHFLHVQYRSNLAAGFY